MCWGACSLLPGFLFARIFFRSPTMLGSLIPSSRFLVNDLLNQIQWQKARVIVEYGPGVGTITQEILRRMRPDAVLLAIELNETFVTFLRTEIDDLRLHAVHASARDVRKVLRNAVGPLRADYIISGIPFSTIPDAVRREILQESRQLLQPEGALSCLSIHQSGAAVSEVQFQQCRADVPVSEYHASAHFLLHTVA